MSYRCTLLRKWVWKIAIRKVTKPAELLFRLFHMKINRNSGWITWTAYITLYNLSTRRGVQMPYENLTVNHWNRMFKMFGYYCHLFYFIQGTFSYTYFSYISYTYTIFAEKCWNKVNTDGTWKASQSIQLEKGVSMDNQSTFIVPCSSTHKDWEWVLHLNLMEIANLYTTENEGFNFRQQCCCFFYCCHL